MLHYLRKATILGLWGELRQNILSHEINFPIVQANLSKTEALNTQKHLEFWKSYTVHDIQPGLKAIELENNLKQSDVKNKEKSKNQNLIYGTKLLIIKM